MGGYGSTRWGWHRKKWSVEESLTLDLARLHKAGLLKKGMLCQPYGQGGGLITWHNVRTGKETSSIYLHVDTHPDNPHLRLEYTSTLRDGSKTYTNEIVRISYTDMRYGGKRAWLHCPRCQKRVRALHNPPGAIRFLCRECHNLAYESAQEAHKYDRGHLAGLIGSYELYEKLSELENQLWKCRGNSKNYRRLRAKIAKLERQLAVGAVAQENFMQRMMADLAALPSLSSGVDIDSLLENIGNQDLDALLESLNTDAELPDFE